MKTSSLVKGRKKKEAHLCYCASAKRRRESILPRKTTKDGVMKDITRLFLSDALKTLATI